jgi:hypothetical protein
MSKDDLLKFNAATGVVEDVDVDEYCFRSIYVFQLLHNGYGFNLDDHITATNVINGQKVGWALGAMMYEINAMPWKYVESGKDISSYYSISDGSSRDSRSFHVFFFSVVFVGILAALFGMFRARTRRNRDYSYEPIKEVSV